MTTKIPAELSSTPGIADSSNATAITINSSEQVGIGTTSPDFLLDVEGSNTQMKVGAASQDGGFLTSTDNNQLIVSGGFYYNGSNFIATSTSASGVSFDNGETAFYNNTSLTDGNSFTLTERMRINSTGNLLLGDGANEDITYTAANKLIMHHGHAFGNIGIYMSCAAYTSNYEMLRFYNGNGQVGNITVGGSNTAFNTSSDYRLKENVTYDWDATTRLKQLKPARFNWIADETNTLVDGFLAHEVSSTVPNAINGEKDAVYTAKDEANGLGKEGEPNMQSIDHSKLVPLLVKTIQELEARITTLEG